MSLNFAVWDGGYGRRRHDEVLRRSACEWYFVVTARLRRRKDDRIGVLEWSRRATRPRGFRTRAPTNEFLSDSLLPAELRARGKIEFPDADRRRNIRCSLRAVPQLKRFRSRGPPGRRHRILSRNWNSGTVAPHSGSALLFTAQEGGRA